MGEIKSELEVPSMPVEPHRHTKKLEGLVSEAMLPFLLALASALVSLLAITSVSGHIPRSVLIVGGLACIPLETHPESHFFRKGPIGNKDLTDRKLSQNRLSGRISRTRETPSNPRFPITAISTLVPSLKVANSEIKPRSGK